MTEPEERPKNYKKKSKELVEEVRRLRELGPRGWTEYELLPLNQMLLDYLKVGELKARATLHLAELEDYAADSAYPYDREHYERWESSIKLAKECIKPNSKPVKQDDDAELLRAEVRTLQDQISDYKANWAEGKTILRGLMIVCVVAIPILFVMGVLPKLHPAGATTTLGLLNWGFLGIVGSLVRPLMALRTSDAVEVGNTDGNKELWRAVLGAGLGLLAGVLAYSMVAAKVVATGLIIPDLASVGWKDVGRSLLLAIGSGLTLERIFDRIHSTAEGQIQ